MRELKEGDIVTYSLGSDTEYGIAILGEEFSPGVFDLVAWRAPHGDWCRILDRPDPWDTSNGPHPIKHCQNAEAIWVEYCAWRLANA
jgi:hypothetical protein